MSGTYQIDGQLFLTNPLEKQWQRQKIDVLGTGEPVFSSYWNLSLSFPIMDFGSGSAGNYLMQHWLDDELHSAVLPHPQSGFLTVFSGIAIDSVQMDIMSFDRDAWVNAGQVTLSHISLDQSWSIPGQPAWWITEEPNVSVGLYGSGSYAFGIDYDLDNWWLTDTISTGSVIMAYQAIAAGDFDASLVNLANPGTYDLQTGTLIPNWDTSTGWNFSVTGSYLDTGYTPQGDLTVVWVMNVEPSGVYAGYLWGSDTYYVYSIGFGAFSVYYHSPYSVNVQSPGSGTYAWGVHKIPSRENNPNYDSLYSFLGAELSTSAINSVATGTLVNSSYSLLFGARNVGGTPTGFETNPNLHLGAYALYNRSLTRREILDVQNNIMDKLNLPFEEP